MAACPWAPRPKDGRCSLVACSPESRSREKKANPFIFRVRRGGGDAAGRALGCDRGTPSCLPLKGGIALNQQVRTCARGGLDGQLDGDGGAETGGAFGDDGATPSYLPLQGEVFDFCRKVGSRTSSCASKADPLLPVRLVAQGSWDPRWTLAAGKIFDTDFAAPSPSFFATGIKG